MTAVPGQSTMELTTTKSPSRVRGRLSSFLPKGPQPDHSIITQSSTLPPSSTLGRNAPDTPNSNLTTFSNDGHSDCILHSPKEQDGSGPFILASSGLPAFPTFSTTSLLQTQRHHQAHLPQRPQLYREGSSFQPVDRKSGVPIQRFQERFQEFRRQADHSSSLSFFPTPDEKGEADYGWSQNQSRRN